MNSDPDRLLNRLVVVALTVFIVASLLLTALIFREIWLQQRIAGLSNGVETNLEDLEEVTEEIQSQLSDMRTTPGAAQNVEGGEDVAKLLENVDQQLGSIEENLDEVLTVLEAESDLPIVVRKEPESEAVQDRADQVFTIFAVLIGITAIAIALLLGMAVSVEDRVSAGESYPQNRRAGRRALDVWRLVA
jgi:hypothetical protein